MGWNIELKSDKEITVGDVQLAVDALPLSFRGRFPSRQSWGWSLEVDVNNPRQKTITLGGSFSASGKIAEGAAQALARQLEKLGHEISVGDLF